MIKNLISVILPAYNAEKYLKEAIDSILLQTYRNFELIVLNDGSTDSTEEIILSYDDPRIKYVKNETNLKLIKTLNKGIGLAQGEYIARMDADDISLPTRFEKEIRMFEKNPELGIVSCFPNNIDAEGKMLGHSSYFVCTKTGSCRFVSMMNPPILHPAVMFRSEVIKRYKYNDSPEYYHVEALELWYRMLEDGVKCEIIPRYLLNYRDNEESVCHVHNDEQNVRGIKFTKPKIELLLGSKVNERALNVLLHKNALNSIRAVRESFSLLNSIKKKYVEKHNIELSDVEKKEITKWCKQRKLSIILTSFVSGKGFFRIELLATLIFTQSLLLDNNNIIYLWNRLVRLRNE